MRRAGPGDLEALLPLVRGYCEADAHVYDEEKVRRAMAPLLEDDSLGQVWLLGDAEPIAALLPVLENFGLRMLAEKLWRVAPDSAAHRANAPTAPGKVCSTRRELPSRSTDTSTPPSITS